MSVQPSYISGDMTVASRGRMMLHITDSIPVKAWKAFAGAFDPLVGIDDSYAAFTGSPFGDGNTSLLCDPNYAGMPHNFQFGPNQWNGTSTLNGSILTGVNALTINTPANGQGQPGNLFFVTLNPGGGTQETVILKAVGAGYTAGSNSFVFTANTTHAHTNGETVSWSRPSGLNQYYPSWCEEYLLLAGTYTTPSQGGESRYFIHDLWYGGGNSGGSGFEAKWFKNGFAFSAAKCRLTQVFISHPLGAGNIWSYAGFAAGVSQFDASTPIATTNFSDFAVVPTYSKVSVDIPVPTNYDPLFGLRTRIVLNGTQTIGSGKVFVAIKSYVQLLDTNNNVIEGTTQLLTGFSGSINGQFNDLGSTQYGVNISANFAQQFISTVGVDTVWVQTGTNWDGDTTATASTLQNQIEHIISTWNCANAVCRCVLQSNYKVYDLTITTANGAVGQFGSTATLADVTGLVPGTFVRFDDHTATTEDVMVQSVNTGTKVVTITDTFQKAHANVSDVRWFISDPTLSVRAFRGPQLNTAHKNILAKNSSNVLFLDGFSGMGAMDHIRTRYIGNIADSLSDWLHPVSDNAQSWYATWMARSWSIASAQATSVTLQRSMSWPVTAPHQ